MTRYMASHGLGVDGRSLRRRPKKRRATCAPLRALGRIETYARAHLDGMTSLYNAETASGPYIAPLTPGRLIQYVEPKTYFDPAGVLVSVDRGSVVGWVYTCVAAGSEGRHDEGEPVARIRMLIYPATRLEVGGYNNTLESAVSIPPPPARCPASQSSSPARGR